MDKLSRGARFGDCSFPSHRLLPSLMTEGPEKKDDPTASEPFKEESRPMRGYYTLKAPKSPDRAMEFLSRTWSPSSTDFYQILSSNGIVPCLEEGKEHDEGLEEQGAEINMVKSNGEARLRMESSLQWKCASNGESATSAHQSHKPFQSGWMNARSVKSWFSREVVGSLSRICRKKRKEELRFHAAQVHAALSVARLASAISGFVANSHLEPNNTACGTGEQHKKMNTVVAAAAALLATVCAETAESVGANRAHIASAIDSGLGMRTATDIVNLTVTAAACFRGARPELWAAATTRASEDRKIFSEGAQLLIRTPAGKVQLRIVWIYLKNGKPTIRLGRKYLGRALTKFKEYRLIHAMGDPREGGLVKYDHGLYSITLSTTEGTVQVLFEDDKQYGLWKSNISRLLSDHQS